MGGRRPRGLRVVGRVGRRDAERSAVRMAERSEFHAVCRSRSGNGLVIPGIDDGISVAHDEGIGPIGQVEDAGRCPVVADIAAMDENASGHDHGLAAETVVAGSPGAGTVGASVGGEPESVPGGVRIVGLALDHEGGIFRFVACIGAEPEPAAPAVDAHVGIALALPDEKRSGEILERALEKTARGRVVDDRPGAGDLKAGSATEGRAVPHLAVAPVSGMVKVVEAQRRADRDFNTDGAADETEPVVVLAKRLVRIIGAFAPVDAETVRHRDKKPICTAAAAEREGRAIRVHFSARETRDPE